MKSAILSSIKRGFGGDSAVYNSVDGELVVSVGWGLLQQPQTTVFCNKQLIRLFDSQSIQPHDALIQLGYEVYGKVDFTWVSSQ